MKVLVINGPNINMLGIREKGIYGNSTYKDLLSFISEYCATVSIEVEFYQSNHEGAIVDKIQSALDLFDGIVINPAAYTHTSIAILDALKAVAIPTIEVHITDTQMREEFRKISYIHKACIKTIQGCGLKGYIMAIDYLCIHINDNVERDT